MVLEGVACCFDGIRAIEEVRRVLGLHGYGPKISGGLKISGNFDRPRRRALAVSRCLRKTALTVTIQVRPALPLRFGKGERKFRKGSFVQG